MRAINLGILAITFADGYEGLEGWVMDSRFLIAADSIVSAGGDRVPSGVFRFPHVCCNHDALS